MSHCFVKPSKYKCTAQLGALPLRQIALPVRGPLATTRARTARVETGQIALQMKEAVVL